MNYLLKYPNLRSVKAHDLHGSFLTMQVINKRCAVFQILKLHLEFILVVDHLFALSKWKLLSF